MEEYIEQCQDSSGGLNLPIWPDVQGWQEGNFSITEVPVTPVPAWFRKMLRSKKNPNDIEKMPLVGG